MAKGKIPEELNNLTCSLPHTIDKIVASTIIQAIHKFDYNPSTCALPAKPDLQKFNDCLVYFLRYFKGLLIEEMSDARKPGKQAEMTAFTAACKRWHELADQPWDVAFPDVLSYFQVGNTVPDRLQALYLFLKIVHLQSYRAGGIFANPSDELEQCHAFISKIDDSAKKKKQNHAKFLKCFLANQSFRTGYFLTCMAHG